MLWGAKFGAKFPDDSSRPYYGVCCHMERNLPENFFLTPAGKFLFWLGVKGHVSERLRTFANFLRKNTFGLILDLSDPPPGGRGGG